MSGPRLNEHSQSSSKDPFPIKEPDNNIFARKVMPDIPIKRFKSEPMVKHEPEAETSADSPAVKSVHDPTNNLSKDLIRALRKGSFFDVRIECGENVVRAHAFILSARFPVFDAMLLTSTNIGQQRTLTVTDLWPSILRDLIYFIYSAKVRHLNMSKACYLLYASINYEVKGLKDICTNYLKSCLSDDTALRILEYGDLYDMFLKEDALRYICNNFSKLKRTETWEHLQSIKPALALQVYSRVVSEYEQNIP